MSPLAGFAVVALLVVFMLLERKRLRGHFLRLVGHSHTATTTLPMALYGIFEVFVSNAIEPVVLGRYFSTFHFGSVLLAFDPPMATEVELIRLLTENRLPEAKALLHEATSTSSASDILMINPPATMAMVAMTRMIFIRV